MKKMIHRLDRNSGSTMIELLIAIVITGLVMTAIAINTMYSIQREAQNRYQETATALAQDTMDLIQAKRAELGWTQFMVNYGSSSPTDTRYFCIDSSGNFYPKSTNNANICSEHFMTFGGLRFNRLVTITNPTTDSMTAVAYVYWQASQEASEYRLSQDFYRGAY